MILAETRNGSFARGCSGSCLTCRVCGGALTEYTELTAAGVGVPETSPGSGVRNSASIEKSLLPSVVFSAWMAMMFLPGCRSLSGFEITTSSHTASWFIANELYLNVPPGTLTRATSLPLIQTTAPSSAYTRNASRAGISFAFTSNTRRRYTDENLPCIEIVVRSSPSP